MYIDIFHTNFHVHNKLTVNNNTKIINKKLSIICMTQINNEFTLRNSYSSFSVIGFRFYRIMIELKKSKMLPPLGSEPRYLSDLLLSSPACYPSAIFPVCWSLSPLDPYVVMLYWFLDLEFFGINRAWLHKDLKSWDFSTREIAEG